MSAPVMVSAAAEVTSEAATVLASLPLSYAPGTTAEHGLAVVSGTGDWPAAAAQALDSGAAAVIVVHPGPAEVDTLRVRNARVVLDTRWAANPVVEAAAEAFTGALPRSSRLECQVRLSAGSSLETALLDQLTLVRALIGPVSDLRLLTWSNHGYAAEGLTAEHPVDLSVVCTDAVPESASVRLLTSDGSVELHIPSGDTAQPARLTVTDPDGARMFPTLYESGHRATWRRAHRILTDRQQPVDLAVFSGDHHQASRAFAHTEG